MADLKRFLGTSPIAGKTKLAGCVVMKRRRMSSMELMNIKEDGEFNAGRVDTNDCELEIGGQVLARGKIIKRRGQSYFKIIDLLFDDTRKGESK